ncbi:flagellar hook-length control protein FliK [Paraglaciecola aquimarina]|uniref:Flagellar hook-length control protein FliK n=1 Tax=Paraglaciecola aquimarina TaxID=1235557 RepID=A0ABU3T0A5_9ALTE|nr:flagellar hook-length control protein FliK [Paraglaciecola aquimarina]MDU0355690.1 flagellar hook-length control protein FliK [Paraglaciecola aquimarina]
MMQQVATTKSEVAVNANTAANSAMNTATNNTQAERLFGSDSNSNKEFEQLLQQQKASHKQGAHSGSSTAEKHSTSSTSKKSEATEQENRLSQQSTDEQREQKRALDNAQSKQNETDSKSTWETKGPAKPKLKLDIVGDGDAAEWVSLVDNLQKFSQGQASDGEPLTPSAMETLVDNLSADKLEVTEDGKSANDSGSESDNGSESEGTDTANSATLTEVPSSSEAVDDSMILNIETSDDFANSPWLSQSLQSVTTKQDGNVDVAGVSQANDELSELTANTKQTDARALEAQQQTDNAEAETASLLPDLTEQENQALLGDLLSESAQVAVDKLLNNKGQSNAEQQVENLDASAADNSQGVGTLAAEQEQEMAESLLSEAVTLNKQVASEQSSSSPILTLSTLPDNKLDSVLTNLAERLLEKAAGTEQISQTSTVRGESSQISELSHAITSPIKEFVASLKSGIAEFKNQLAQGREPGIDLKSLVTDSIDKLASVATSGAVVEGSAQVLSNFSQVLDFAANLNRAMEQQSNLHGQTYNALQREVSQIQGEQIKQSQLTQVESKFEKAVNIAKPEGIQQLAEKVRWLANTKNLVAEIRLDPAELGSVHVKVAMQGEAASVNFVVQSQQARDAMDNAVPRLREMLAEKGIELGQSSVRQESDGQAQQGDEQLADGNSSPLGGAEDENNLEQTDIQQKVVNGALGGIDYFV